MLHFGECNWSENWSVRVFFPCFCILDQLCSDVARKTDKTLVVTSSHLRQMGNKQSTTGLADKLTSTCVINDGGQKLTIVQVVQAFWFDVVEEKRSDIALGLYNGLFSAHPEYLSVFGTDGQNRQRAEAQMSRLIHMLSSFVQNLTDLEHLDARIKQVGRLHANIGLPVAAYGHLTEALCEALELTVPDHFTPSIAYSLKEVLDVCGSLMVEEQVKHDKKASRRQKIKEYSPVQRMRALRNSPRSSPSSNTRRLPRKDSGPLNISSPSMSSRRVSLASTMSTMSVKSDLPAAQAEVLVRDDHFFDFLRNARCLSYFQLFLARELASENLMFYRDVTRWTALKEPRRRVEEARRIFDEYIPHDARSPINVSHATRNILILRFQGNSPSSTPDLDPALSFSSTNMISSPVVSPIRSSNNNTLTARLMHDDAFEPAFSKVVQIMQHDLFPRFRKSEVCTALLESLQGSEDFGADF
ncbi:MAG: hypothetical protein MHM6MM_000401 [Cercozoa sp. M6MM]